VHTAKPPGAEWRWRHTLGEADAAMITQAQPK
jgi:hypothetical protein